MLVFDQLRKNDSQLRLLAIVIALAFLALLAGLWWVQIVKAREFRASEATQSYSTVRLQSVRGKILDRNGVVLAENRASYNICVYLEDLSPAFRNAFNRLRPREVRTNDLPFWKNWLGFPTITTNAVRLNAAQKSEFNWNCRLHVVNEIIQQLATALGTPIPALRTNDFKNHYATRLALPFPILRDATPQQIARFSEQLSGRIAAGMEIQSTRVYPQHATAAHLLGYVRRDTLSDEDEERTYEHRLSDFLGVVGIEGYFDRDLRGQPGGKAVLVNNVGYRQGESIVEPTEPGRNVVLTLDLRIQQAAERSFLSRLGPDKKGAVVVMDVNTGDVLALVSLPAYDPNNFVTGFQSNDVARWNDVHLGVQKNKATQEIYQPGSIFKSIVGLAALENGLNPDAFFTVQPNPAMPSKGAIFVGRDKVKIRDTAEPGEYNFKKALFKSSNSYFVAAGQQPGVLEKVIGLGEKLHFNEKAGIPTRQDVSGDFPTQRKVSSPGWNPGDTAYLCIGQGKIAVTPLQMTVMTAALANGGKVLETRLVQRIESQNPLATEPPRVFEAGQLRNQLPIRKKNFQLLYEAMLADTETHGATAYTAFQARANTAGGKPIMRVCGKTGTAERLEHGIERNTVWFSSFAPYEQPRYAVVVMVEDGGSGGGTCAPIAADVYTALDKMEAEGKPPVVAKTN